MVNAVECRRQIRVQGPYPRWPRAFGTLEDGLDRVMTAAAGPEAIRLRLDRRLPLRLQCIQRDRLQRAVSYDWNGERALLPIRLRDEHPARGPGRPRGPLLHPPGQLRLVPRLQHDLAVKGRRHPASIQLRYPPHASQRVTAGTQHQLLQTTDLRQVPVPRRREDPLPQPPYVPLGNGQFTWSQPGAPPSGPFTAAAATASNLPFGSSAVITTTSTGSPNPRQRPFRPGHRVPIRPVICGGQQEDEPFATVSRRLSATGIRFPGHPCPAGDLSLPCGQPTGPGQRRAGPHRGCHVPHIQDATGLGALSTPGRRCSPGAAKLPRRRLPLHSGQSFGPLTHPTRGPQS